MPKDLSDGSILAKYDPQDDTQLAYVKEAFTLDPDNYFIKNYTHQTVHYDRTAKKIYVPLFGGNATVKKYNENVILVYNNINTAIADNTSNLEYNDSLNINHSDTKRFFEIEGCGFLDDVLWFSTNEGKGNGGTRENGGIYTYN